MQDSNEFNDENNVVAAPIDLELIAARPLNFEPILLAAPLGHREYAGDILSQFQVDLDQLILGSQPNGHRAIIENLSHRYRLFPALAPNIELMQNFAPAREPEMPAKGINHDIIEEINCEDVPENYLCALGAFIMTDPVFDPQHPQYKFERSWIMQSLITKNENPFTKTVLTAVELVSDANLKIQIDTFVAAQRAQYDSSRALIPKG